MTAEDHRNALTDELKRKGHVRSTPVEAAFRAVPRHLFVPEVNPELAYHDEVIPIETSSGEGASSASQPAIVAEMLEQLGLTPGQKVLEVGAGSGYNAALMAHAVGEEGRVVTVEIEDDLARRAHRGLGEAGFGRAEVVHADGSLGYPEEAPYDRIIVTAGAPDITPAWTEQLRPEGRLVLPLEIWPDLQVCTAFEPVEDHLESVAAQWCGFLSLRGESAGQEEAGHPPEKGAVEERLRQLREESLISGHSSPEGLQIRAYPQGSDPPLAGDESVVEKRWTRLVLDWR